MNLDSNEEQKKLVQIASLLLVEEATLFAAVLGSRRRKLNVLQTSFRARSKSQSWQKKIMIVLSTPAQRGGRC